MLLSLTLPCGEGACPRWAAKRPPTFFQTYIACRIYDGCAAERGQAPSPQSAHHKTCSDCRYGSNRYTALTTSSNAMVRLNRRMPAGLCKKPRRNVPAYAQQPTDA
jgi:hypothetical protein